MGGIKVSAAQVRGPRLSKVLRVTVPRHEVCVSMVLPSVPPPATPLPTLRPASRWDSQLTCFYFSEHANYFGVDEKLGPVAVSIKREKLEDHKDHGPQYQYRIIFRTREVGPGAGSVSLPLLL